MPIYEYACTACGERVEAKQSFDDPPLETCEICGGKLRKLYSPVGVVFKGSGFYATDSKKKGSSSSSNSSSSSSGSKSESKSSTPSSDSKTTSISSGSGSSSSSSKE